MHFLRYLFVSVQTWFLLYTCHKIAKCSHIAVIMCRYGFYTYFYTMQEYDSKLTVLLHKVVNTV